MVFKALYRSIMKNTGFISYKSQCVDKFCVVLKYVSTHFVDITP